ncbi:MAG: hypothetical protein IKA61_01390 [Clostridia bacterium]|nr:hypothetical protein [Clostridia bacterium]
MKNALRNKLLALSSLIMAVAVALGIAQFNKLEVKATEPVITPPTVEMLNGARVKTVGERAFLVYEAVVSDYSAELEDYEYGFIVMDKTTFTSNDFSAGYHTVAIDLIGIYDVDAIISHVSTSRGTADIKGYFEVTDYQTSYIAIAYVHSISTDEYTYAHATVENNSRSAAFVAQMAINYDGIDEARYEELAPIAGDTEYMYSRFSAVSGENTVVNAEGGSISVNEGDNFVVEASFGRFSWDPGFERGMVSKVNYEALTEVSFDVMIPAEADVSWWGFTPLADKALGDAYIGAGTVANLKNYVSARDTWHTVKYVTVDGLTWDVFVGIAGEEMTDEHKVYSYTIPEAEIGNYKDADGKSYIAIIGEYGKNNVNLFAQLDNFTVVADYGAEYTDDFDGAESTLFDFGRSQLGGIPARIVFAGKAGIEMNSNLGVDFVAHLDTANGEAAEGYHVFQTVDKYQGITEITFDAYVYEDSATENNWWGISFTDKTEQDNYTDAAAGFVCLQSYEVRGKWASYRYTTTDGKNWTISYGLRGEELVEMTTKTSTLNVNDTPSYVFFASAPTNPGAVGIRVDIDNVIIVTGAFTYVEDFSGAKSDLFIERADVGKDPLTFIPAIVEEEQEPVDGEGHLVLDFKKFGESGLNVYSKEAYTNITEFWVDVYLPSANEDNVWSGFTPVSRVSGVDGYFAACTGGLRLDNKLLNYGWQDGWVTLKYTVSGGVWTLNMLYNGNDVTEGGWTLDASGADYSSNGASYIALSACPAKTFEWGMWIDNVKIVADGVTYEDNFNDGTSSLLYVNPAVGEYVVEYPSDEEETPEGEGHLVVDFKQFGEAGFGLYTKEAYTNITELWVDVYLPSANESHSWFGFTPASRVSGVDAYYAACTGGLNLNSGKLTYYGWLDGWVTLKYTVTDGVWKLNMLYSGNDVTEGGWTLDASGADYSSNGASYIALSACPAQAFEWGMMIDNVKIVANGVTYEDNFNRGESTLFAYTSAVTLDYTPPVGYEPPVEEEPEAPKTLLELMAEGKANEYFANSEIGAAVSIGYNLTVCDGVDGDALLATLAMNYKLGATSEFVIMLSSEDFIYVSADSIMLYADGAVQGTVQINAQYAHELRVAVLGNGCVLVSADHADFVALGYASAESFAVKGISLADAVLISEITLVHPIELDF